MGAGSASFAGFSDPTPITGLPCLNKRGDIQFYCNLICHVFDIYGRLFFNRNRGVDRGGTEE